MSKTTCEEWLRSEVERLELRLATLESELGVARLEVARLRERPPRPARAPGLETPGAAEIHRRHAVRLALRCSFLAAALRVAAPGHPLLCSGTADVTSNENQRERRRKARG